MTYSVTFLSLPQSISKLNKYWPADSNADMKRLHIYTVEKKCHLEMRSKIVKRLRGRKYDPLIIERTICLVLGLSTVLYRSFLNDCTPTNKAVGTI